MIKAKDLLNINSNEYKLHLATLAPDGNNPLNAFVRDKKEWEGWHTYRGSKNDWTREFIFSLIKFNNDWLFGGIFRVLERHINCYEIELTNKYENLIGRLVISGIPTSRGQGRAFNLETYYDKFEINRILQNVYDGEDFPGYENI